MPAFTENLKAGTWLGFADVDIKIPKLLWMKFKEMPSFFFNIKFPKETVPQHMKDYCTRIGWTHGNGGKLLGVLGVQKLLL